MSTTVEPTSDLAVALELADIADRITMARFQATDLVVESKPDLTPVSDADKAVEDAVRAHLTTVRPDDAIIGEERGATGTSSRRWIVDPIDGTRNFVRGVPVWATLIALAVDEVIVAGVVTAPALHRRWWASIGDGAFTCESDTERFFDPARARRIHVSAVSEVGDAFLSYSSIHGWKAAGLGQGFDRLIDSTWYSRAYGDFYSYMLVAEGAVDIACEPELALHDMAALVPIVKEAGGVFTSVAGEDGPWGANALAANPDLHAKIRAFFA